MMCVRHSHHAKAGMQRARARDMSSCAYLQVSVSQACAVEVLQAAEDILGDSQDHVLLHALRELQGTQPDDARPLNRSARSMQVECATLLSSICAHDMTMLIHCSSCCTQPGIEQSTVRAAASTLPPVWHWV